jgi:periplasmic protein TonB
MAFDFATSLSRTPAGDAELRTPQNGLSLGQRKLLTWLDTAQSGAALAAAHAIDRDKLARDLDKLATLGLVATGGAHRTATAVGDGVVLGGLRAPPSFARYAIVPVVVVAAAIAWLLLHGGTQKAPPSAPSAAGTLAAASADAAAPQPASDASPAPHAVPIDVPLLADASRTSATPPRTDAKSSPAIAGDLPAPAAPGEKVAEHSPAAGEQHAVAEPAAAPPVPAAAAPVPAAAAPAPSTAAPAPASPSTERVAAMNAGSVAGAPPGPTRAPEVVAEAAPQHGAANAVPAPAAAPVPPPLAATAPAIPPSGPAGAAAHPQAAEPAHVAMAAPASAEARPPAAARLVPLTREEPAFPREAFTRGITNGTVKARLVVDAAGKVTSVSIVDARPTRVFDHAVTDALSHWTFPAGDAGRSTEVEVAFRRD